MEFKDYARNTIEYEYYDEKFMPPASDDQRFSVFQSLASHAQIESKLLRITNRRVPYLLIVPSFVWANIIPQIAKSFPSKEVFFTTPDRLATRTKWHEALFQIDQIRNLFHFYDDSLSVCIHEKRLTRV